MNSTPRAAKVSLIAWIAATDTWRRFFSKSTIVDNPNVDASASSLCVSSNSARAALLRSGYHRARDNAETPCRRETARRVLPDFFIGAHAAVAQLPLWTRDPSRYQSYFSGIALITPDTEPI
jgi:hypothetical protein